MNENRTYTNVMQMVRETSDDESFAHALEKRVLSRRVVKDLMALRATHGLSQKDIAEKLGCTQSRISKLESTIDNDLRLGDLAQYANAVGLRVSISLEPMKRTPVDRVQASALRIKHELDQLAKLSENNQRIATGVAAFFGETFFNLVKMLQDSVQKLPRRSPDGEPFISIEICGGDADGEGPEAICEPTHADDRDRAIEPLTQKTTETHAID